MSSRRSPTIIEVQIPNKQEDVHIFPTTKKNTSQRNSVIHEEEDPSSYNIKEIFEAFTFNLYTKEVSRNRVCNEKQNDGTMKEIKEDEVLFENTDEDLVTIVTLLAALSQDTAHNVTVFNEKLS